MLQRQIHRIGSMVVLICLLAAAGLNASSATVFVSATVLPWVKMDVRQHQNRYTIAPADIARNYIDIPYSATVAVETNVSVLLLTLVPAGGEQIAASINGENRYAGTLEIALTEHEKYARHVTRDLDFRIFLDSDSQAGSYVLDAWISIQAY